MVIQTEALGLSAAEVERLVVVPLEELLAPTPLLDEIRSESVPGLSVRELVFQPGTDTLIARQLVQESLSSVFTLPNVVILGGLVTSTLLNLFVVPSLYLRYGKSPAERELVAAQASIG